MPSLEPAPKRPIVQYPTAPPSGASVYGAWVANDSFVTALLRHGTFDRYEFWTDAGTRHEAARRLEDLRPGRATTIGTADLRSRRGDLDALAWHVLSSDGEAAFYVRESCAERAYPISLVHHSISYQEFLHLRFLPLLLAEMLPCDAIVCTSTAARQSMERLLDTVAERFNARYGTHLRRTAPLETIPLGVDTERLVPLDRTACRYALELPTEPVVILWLGRVSATDKGDLAPLLAAFSDVLRYVEPLSGPATPAPLLVVAGADPHGDARLLEHYAGALGISDRVRFFSQVDAYNRNVFYGAADVFVAPVDNIQETFGLSPVEAMASGTPQVVADWNGYRDTVVDGETGLLIPTTWTRADEDLIEDPLCWRGRFDHAALAQSVVVDPTALRAALIRLVLDEPLRQRMAVASRRRAEQVFSWSTVIGRYEELWTHLSGVARATPLPQPPARHYREPFFFEAFNHYATTVIDDTQRLRASAAGRAALEHESDLAPRFRDTDTAVMRATLQALGERELSIEELIDSLRGEGDSPLPPSALRREIMRVVKYGYAQLA